MKTVAIFLTLLPTLVFAESLKVITTTTDLAWLAQQIGGEHVQVESLLNGSEDAHYLDAKPNFIRKVSNADVVCFNGLSLEVGWLPKVLSKSGNAGVQNGGSGHCDAGSSITAIEKPVGRLDRSMGDVHPEGNPHYTLSPVQMIEAGETVMATLVAVDLDRASVYVANHEKLKSRLVKLKESVQKKMVDALGPLDKIKTLQYHRELSYFLEAYGFAPASALEQVPGVAPSAGRLAKVSVKARSQGVKLVLGTVYSPEKLLQQFERISGVPYLMLPISIQKKGPVNTYEKLQANIAERIIQSLKE